MTDTAETFAETFAETKMAETAVSEKPTEEKETEENKPTAPAHPGQSESASAKDRDDYIVMCLTQLRSNDDGLRVSGAQGLRKLLSIEREPPIDQVLSHSAGPVLVEAMQSPNHVLAFEAAWAVTNIASGNSEQCRSVIEDGCVPVFAELLRSDSTDLLEQAVWGLGNIAGDSAGTRDLVLNTPGLQDSMLRIFEDKQPKMSLLRNAAWTISNLCRGKPAPNFEQVRRFLPILTALLNSTDDEVLTDALWALSYLSDGADDRIQAVIDAGNVGRVVELLSHPAGSVATPALRTMGNIVTGSDAQTQATINAGLLPFVVPLLSHTKRGIRKEACWLLSNVTAGNVDHIQAVIEVNAIPTLVEMATVAEFDIRKEACWALSNATAGGTAAQMAYLVGQNAHNALASVLSCADPRLIIVGLEGLDNMLRVEELREELVDALQESGAIENLEVLQEHENQEVYEKSVALLEQYFGAEEEEVGGGLSKGPLVKAAFRPEATPDDEDEVAEAENQISQLTTEDS